MFVGDGVDGSAPWLEAVGDIQEDAQAMAEVSSIVVHEVSSRDVRKLDIEEGPVLLISGREDPLDDDIVNQINRNLHLIVKIF